MSGSSASKINLTDFSAQARQLYAYCKESGIVDAAQSARKLHKAGHAAPSLVGSAGAVYQVVQSVRSYHEVRAQETTRRAEIAATLQRDLAEIELARQAITHCLSRTFDERQAQFTQLFAGLDRAQEAGDLQGMALILDSVLALAQVSPFKTLNEIRQLVRQSDFVLEL